MPCIAWVQASDAWALRVPPFHICPKSTYCSFACRGLEACLHSLPSILFDLLCELLFNFPLPLGAELYLILGLTFFFRPLSWSPSFPVILLCHSCCNDRILLGLFRPAIYSFPQWLSMAIGFPTYGLLCPFCLSLRASLAHLISLGFLGLFTNSVFPWAFTNFIGFPWPNYLILILGVHGPAINSLLSLFALLWACGGPFSPFYIIYCPQVCYFFLSKLL